MGKTGTVRRAGFAVGDDFLELLLHAITSFRVGWVEQGDLSSHVPVRQTFLHFEFKTSGLRPRTAPYSFDARQKSKQKSAPRSLPAFGGFPPLRDRRACGQDSLRSVVRPFRPPVAPLRRRHRGITVLSNEF
jgi:hypothetical protein